MIKSKILCLLPIDNTKRFICAIHDKDIGNEILKIFLHPVEKYNTKTPEMSSPACGWYENTLKRLNVINDHIKNNKYEFILCNDSNVIIQNNAQLLDEYKNITYFEPVTLTKQLSLVTMSKKVFNLNYKKEMLNKQSKIDEIKKALIIENLSIDKIKQLQSILDIK